MEEIPVVREYEDVFKALEGLLPSRSNPFSITLEPGSAAIAKAPYRIVPRVGEVAYRLELPPDMPMHPVFHVSMLCKHIPDPNMVEPQRPENLKPNLTYPEGPLRIGERRIKKLKNREISQVQVFWGKQQRVVITWEDEDKFRADYPELFSDTPVVQ
ncbi:uncharacterized protein LOC125595843 [Brassica napus]|uniref:uncharacterized protein LOC125595843 n=1 Tax=Brassica napus TaxID=3708 RepID=UPI002078AE82|nr:uncharacterized protein LOC125595843 [Brassica napus]